MIMEAMKALMTIKKIELPPELSQALKLIIQVVGITIDIFTY
jgi:hypothetical protein